MSAAIPEDSILFDAPSAPAPADGEPWNVLVVDDDEQVHALTRLVLRYLRFRDRPIHLVSASSGLQARAILRSGTRFGLALIDVVMESPQAGLELIRYIREELRNRAIRLILRTGQPGQAPEQDVVIAYEIDDYKAKTEFSAQKMVTGVIASLRAYSYIVEIEQLNTDLEARVAMRTAELRRLAMLDPLTEAGNRRHLEERAQAELAVAGRPIGLAVLDLDHFKQVNDRYGHAAGDAVLKSVVGTVKDALRADDFLARLGGEEFVLLLPEVSPEQAAARCERLRAAIAARPVAFESQRIAVTASIGVTALDAGGLGAALERADRALYLAKQQGRDRVLLAAPH